MQSNAVSCGGWPGKPLDHRRAREPTHRADGGVVNNLNQTDNVFFFPFSRRVLISQRSAYLVHPHPKRLPPRAPDGEIRQLIVGGFRTDVELEERVRDGMVEGHVHGFECLESVRQPHVVTCRLQGREGERADHDDFGVPDDGVCQREGQDDLDLERRDVAVRSDVVHHVQQPEVAVRGFGSRTTTN